MALRESNSGAGAPWRRRLCGVLDELTVESELLSGNPLGDPATRPLLVYRSPGVVAGEVGDAPCVYVLQGYGGQVDKWMARDAFSPTLPERLDAMFEAAGCPEAIVVFVDAWTSLGGSQFLNSTSTGPYLDYLCEEIVPFIDERYPTRAGREHRAVAGHSSGGYGAMVSAMRRPDVFGAFASHAGDALFECSLLPDFRQVVRTLRDHFGGSYEELLEAVQHADHFDWGRFGTALSMYAYAAAYTPDPEQPGRALLPFDPHNGQLDDDVWGAWLEHDPVRMASRHATALHSMRRIYLDAGRSDEYYLDLGTQAFSAELTRLGVQHTLELFDGRHSGISYRYPRAIRELVLALEDDR